jgi:hypothetical protein
MTGSESPPDEIREGAGPRRLFIHEPGWRIGQKVGSVREFCYAIAPGQDYYHRLLDGELFLFHGDERLCLACAERRGLLAYSPKNLREAPTLIEIESGEIGEWELLFRPDEPGKASDSF